MDCRDLPVGASPLLPEHQSHSHGESVENFGVRESQLDLVYKWQLFVSAEVLDNIFELLGDLGVVDWPRANGGEGLAGFVDAVLLNKPARRLVSEEESNEENSAGKHLQSEGHAPLTCIRATHVLDSAVVDEERQTDTGDAMRVVSIDSYCCGYDNVDLLEQLHTADASLWKVSVGVLIS
jgi:hypothetical protein